MLRIKMRVNTEDELKNVFKNLEYCQNDVLNCTVEWRDKISLAITLFLTHCVDYVDVNGKQHFKVSRYILF